MCSECRMNPCHPRCPNAFEINPIYECKLCGYGIFEGDSYFDGPNGCICEECMNDMSTEELLEMLDEHMQIA